MIKKIQSLGLPETHNSSQILHHKIELELIINTPLLRNSLDTYCSEPYPPPHTFSNAPVKIVTKRPF